MENRNARITIQLGLVISVGGYETVRPSVEMEVDVHPGEDVEDVYQEVMEELEWMLEDMVETLVRYTHAGRTEAKKT